LRVAFAGTPEFALPALTALCAHHEVAGVLTPPDRRSGRGQQLTPSPVKAEAMRRALPLLQPATLRDATVQTVLRDWNVSALVVVAYGLLLPRDILSLPPLGCLNIHASLLPRWRGAAPIERAILSGDLTSGVSIMQMDAGLDTGPVLLTRTEPIGERDTAGSLSGRLAALGAEALLEVLAGVWDGTLQASPQPAEGVTYAAKIEKREARIDWGESAGAIDRRVRAFNPRPVADTVADGEPLRIFESRAAIGADHEEKITNSRQNGSENGTIVGTQGEAMTVQCGHGQLDVFSVQRPGRRPVSGREYAQGRVGRRLG
jgi:methionyl-tRNA formyltransferase